MCASLSDVIRDVTQRANPPIQAAPSESSAFLQFVSGATCCHNGSIQLQKFKLNLIDIVFLTTLARVLLSNI